MSSLPQPDSQHQRLIGEKNRYRLERRLGQGGMGEVYLAIDMLLGKQVALKLLKAALVETEEVRKRFAREVSLCAALSSENIVQVSDYGITPEGHPFFVMEYLSGQTLGQLLRREKRLAVEHTVAIISQVCTGLQLAHQGVVLQRQGSQTVERVKIVHRDLKPDNIFLVPTGLGELVKILDFGIAKILDGEAELTNLQTDMFIGTFHYASPEQLEVAMDLDGRADIYSLGMMLYEMLSGTDPFGLMGKTGGSTASSWIRAHTSLPPKPLRSQPGCETLPSALEAVVMQCLQKQPSQRCSTVEILQRSLRAAISPPLISPTRPLVAGNFDTTVGADAAAPASNPPAALPVPEGTNPPATTLPPPEKNPGEFPSTAMEQKISTQLSDLTQNSQRELATLLTQVIGPIAPLLLNQALVEGLTCDQLLERLLNQIPALSRPQVQAQIQSLFNPASLEVAKPAANPTQLAPVATEVQSSLPSRLNLPPPLAHKLEALLTQAIGPLAPLLLQQSLKQAATWQSFIQGLLMQVPEAARRSLQAQVYELLQTQSLEDFDPRSPTQLTGAIAPETSPASPPRRS
ncbi:serine/threonine-protein kinase [Neosynechococcus sphagnicola]|uniref:serine/threonine-protein kinase n=1 Tax=Neosynechococcus sphagnicola TaxID=1501145 RepID=UPI00068A058A|nr:serine/threonine-protein kinase [Neosynechococcus sphagnicola]